jgi:hypothetical protein
LSKIKKLGFVISHLTVNQLSYQLISNANRLLGERDDVDVSIFFANDGPRVVQPRFACYCLFEAFGYNGHTIATSIQTASRVLSYPGPNRNQLWWYMWDLDWLRLPAESRQYEQLAQLYMNPKFNLVVRSADHFNIVKSVWREPASIIEDANIEEFAQLVGG